MDVEAADGLRLSGFQVVPAGVPRAAMVWVHGFGVPHDLPECVRLGRALAEQGVAFVAGQIRGHDGGSVGWKREGSREVVVRTGGWWEIFEESAMDVAAWVRQAASVARPLVLAGHSFGCLRAVYYLSETSDAQVAGLALVSPSFGLRHLDAGVAKLANTLVRDGRGDDLLPPGSWARGFGTDTVSARTYASWWRVAPTMFESNPTRFAAIHCPLLTVYGGAGDVGGLDEIAYVHALAEAAPSRTGRILPEIRHRYAGGEIALASTLVNWMGEILNRVQPGGN